MSRVATRGGSVPPLTLEMAQHFFDVFKAFRYGWVRARIIMLANDHGEFHADMVADLALPEPNMIGAAVNALAKWGLLEKLNRHGEVEHRRGASPASHGRSSYVWRLTSNGRSLASRMDRSLAAVEAPDDHDTYEPPANPAVVPIESSEDLF